MLQASCETTGEALSDRVDGELRGLRKFRVVRHLARCGRCRETLESLGDLVQLLRELGTLEGSELNDA